MSQLFRLALVGAGRITRQFHLPAARSSPLVEVTAIVDPVYERAAELARNFGIKPKIVEQMTDVLDEVDGAIIATPNDSHAPIAITCLEAGVSTLIEKPLASNYADGKAIVNAAEIAFKKNGTVAAIGYSTRFRNNVLLLSELLNRKYFGTVKRFAHQLGSCGGWSPLSSYNLSQEATGGGVLMVTGTHFLDRMLHFWGYPDEIMFLDDSQGGPEANCTAKFHFVINNESLEGTIAYSKTINLPGGLVLKTDKGIVILEEKEEADVVFRPDRDSSVEHIIRSCRACHTSAFQRQLEDFVEASKQGRPPLVDSRQGLLSLKLTKELYAKRQPIDTNWYRPMPLRS